MYLYFERSSMYLYTSTVETNKLNKSRTHEFLECGNITLSLTISSAGSESQRFLQGVESLMRDEYSKQKVWKILGNPIKSFINQILIVMLLYDIFSHISLLVLVSEIDPLRFTMMKINDCAWKQNWWKLKFEKFTISDSHPPAYFSHSSRRRSRRFFTMLINDWNLNCCIPDSRRRDSDFIIPDCSSNCDNALINWSASRASNSQWTCNFMIFLSHFSIDRQGIINLILSGILIYLSTQVLERAPSISAVLNTHT